MNYTYLTANHFLDYSCSRRRVAALDFLSFHDFMEDPYAKEWMRLTRGETIFNYIQKLIDQQPRVMGIYKRKSIRLGSVNFKYVKKHWARKKPGFIVSMVGKDYVHDKCYFRDDQDFLFWFYQNYNFEGFGTPLTDSFIHGALLNLIEGYLQEIKKHFHNSLSTQNRNSYSFDHKADRYSTMHLALVSIRNSIVARTYALPIVPNFNRKPRSEIVGEFEQVCNEFNGTDYAVVQKWFNNASDAKDAQQYKELVLEMVRCIVKS